MYAQEPDLTRIRQGDILDGFDFPKYSLAKSRFTCRRDPGEVTFSYDNQMVIPTESRKVVVASQCCEFNEGKRDYFLVGPLLPLREYFRLYAPAVRLTLVSLVPFRRTRHFKKMTPEQLKDANTIKRGEDNPAVNVYWFDTVGERLTEPFVADFAQMVSVSMQDLDFLTKSKILQLEDRERLRFQVKLAYFYGRVAKPDPEPGRR